MAAARPVRLPAAFRFEGKEVFIRKDEKTGDVILSEKPTNWDGFFAARAAADVPDDFLSPEERAQGEHRPDPFEGWVE